MSAAATTFKAIWWSNKAIYPQNFTDSFNEIKNSPCVLITWVTPVEERMCGVLKD